MTAEDAALPGSGRDPGAAIDVLAAELAGIERRTVGDAVEFAVGGSVFAVREGPVHSFRLRPEVVAAGLRTPATARSSRGAGWITLRSGAGDDYTLDRARAWFELAWRLAGGEPQGVEAQDR